MTLIAVVVESDDALLIAADNLERGAGGYSVTPRSKLHKTKGGSFAWACSGNATVGDWVSTQLAGNAPSSWEAITGINGFRTVVASINGGERGIVALARTPWRDDNGATCVLAGWLGDVFGVWDIDANGQPTPHLEHGVLFEGGPVKEAHLIWDALADSKKPILDKLRRIYEVLGARLRMIDEHPDIWRITKEGMTIVQGRDNEQTPQQ